MKPQSNALWLRRGIADYTMYNNTTFKPKNPGNTSEMYTALLITGSISGCLQAPSEIDTVINFIKLDRSVAATQPQASSPLHSPQQKIVTRKRQIEIPSNIQ